MKTEEIKNITKALLAAQKQMGAAVKGSKNPFFKSNYADLPTVMEVVKEPLNDNGIVILQPCNNKEGKNFINTMLIHSESGEWLSSETEVICSKQNDPQAFGAAQTYARRFGLQSMLFIPAEDDDGNYASGRVEKAVAKSYPTPSTPVKQEALETVKQTTTVAASLVASGSTSTALISSESLPLGAIQMEPFKKSSSSFKRKATTEVVSPVTTTKEATEW
jgi:hypothetical protein